MRRIRKSRPGKRKKKSRNSDGGAILFLIFAIGLIYFVFGGDDNTGTDNISYDKQIKQLNKTENNVRSLLKFIKEQKQKLRETEDLLNKLKNENEKLVPVVEANREVVDAIFQTQEQRNRRSIWLERTISFLLGILASLIAAFIWHWVIRKAPEENE